ncbi:hypothetical protein F5Y19DRAFT_410923 [Xylariaceae sp. FL1651]|nr:hypothetical protein F5Y19DRAFT_410923 [Xylariaceae sp. FL1651]
MVHMTLASLEYIFLRPVLPITDRLVLHFLRLRAQGAKHLSGYLSRCSVKAIASCIFIKPLINYRVAMVGVAGKSQACNTCRERRLKCDLRRPICRKCVKAKRVCTGYDRGERVFVNRTPSNPSTDAPSVLAGLRTCLQLGAVSANSEPEAELRRLFSDSSSNSGHFRRYALELLQATYLPKNLSVESRQGSFSWVYGLADLTQPSKLLDTSLFAFCLSQFHVTKYGSTTLYHCLRQYDTALQYLALDLGDPVRILQEETLAAILVLSTCELFVCPGSQGWSTHARGIAEILRLQEPGRARTPAWQHLATRMRVVCTLEALTKRQGQLILNNDVWRQVVNECGVNGPLDEVYHMVAGVPTMFGQAVTLSSISDTEVFLKESAIVAQSMLNMVQTIETWQERFLSGSETPRLWLIPSSAENPADMDYSDKVFPSCFEFEALAVATPVTMCWSVIAQLLSNVIQILELAAIKLGHCTELNALLEEPDDATRKAAESPFAQNKPRSIDDLKRNGSSMARNVCQSLEYFHRTDMGTFGSHVTTYPRWSARQYFRLHTGYDREKAWIENVDKMKGTGTRWGLTMMEFPDIATPLSIFTKTIQQPMIHR